MCAENIMQHHLRVIVRQSKKEYNIELRKESEREREREKEKENQAQSKYTHSKMRVITVFSSMQKQT